MESKMYHHLGSPYVGQGENLVVRVVAIDGVIKDPWLEEAIGWEIGLANVLLKLVEYREVAGEVMLGEGAREGHRRGNVVVVHLPRPPGSIQHVEERRLVLGPPAVRRMAGRRGRVEELPVGRCRPRH